MGRRNVRPAASRGYGGDRTRIGALPHGRSRARSRPRYGSPHGIKPSPAFKVSQEDSFASRLTQSQATKERLGEAARKLVEDGEAVFVDSSTTAYFAVRSLLTSGMRVMVLTNSVPVMELVSQTEMPQTELIGCSASTASVQGECSPKPTRSRPR